MWVWVEILFESFYICKKEIIRFFRVVGRLDRYRVYRDFLVGIWYGVKILIVVLFDVVFLC